MPPIPVTPRASSPQETLGNGLSDAYSRDANTGHLLTIRAGASGAVESASYR